MRLKALVVVCAAVAGFLLATAFGIAAPQRPLSLNTTSSCPPGYVDAIIGGEHKCLHAGEFCATRYEADYEKYGFTCVNGRLTYYAVTTATSTTGTTATPPPGVVYHPPARTKRAGCRTRNAMPDRACTPGSVFASVTLAQICAPGYSTSVRNVPRSEKQSVYREYRIRAHRSGAYEVDHLIPLELGGSNLIANLWPEAARPRPGFHEKDLLENELHFRVCSGSMSLALAERIIATNWRAEYKALFG